MQIPESPSKSVWDEFNEYYYSQPVYAKLVSRERTRFIVWRLLFPFLFLLFLNYPFAFYKSIVDPGLKRLYLIATFAGSIICSLVLLRALVSYFKSSMNFFTNDLPGEELLKAKLYLKFCKKKGVEPNVKVLESLVDNIP